MHNVAITGVVIISSLGFDVDEHSRRLLDERLRRAGFEIVSEDPSAGRNFLVVARRPAGQGQTACPQSSQPPA